MVVWLRNNISELNGYELYNHLSEQNSNRWHPIYIRKPLLDILAGCKSQEEQIIKLLYDSGKLLGLLEKSVSFKQLRIKYWISS
jgi:hypothetical protein